MDEFFDRRRLEDAMEEWTRSICVHDIVGPNLHMVATWVDLCAPPRASAENKLLAAKDLAVVFFALDDYDQSDVAEVFAACERALLAKETAKRDANPLANAYSLAVREIESRGNDMSSYRESRRALIRSYRERNRVRSERGSLDFSQHLERRRTTIYTRQWIGLWELLEDCMLTPEERDSDCVVSALKEIVDWQILENELVSVERDRRRGELNLVSILSREQSTSLRQAAFIVAAMHRSSARRLEALLRTLRARGGSRAFRRYVEILERCYRGAVEINEADLTRYARFE